MRVLFFYVPYIYKNRVLAYFQTRPKFNINTQIISINAYYVSCIQIFDIV